ncbi:MAG: LamG-like jellyroll fold domain-containing protein [Nannocystaceae bacterium]|nr:LamG domain-containing protein [bacterium]
MGSRRAGTRYGALACLGLACACAPSAYQCQDDTSCPTGQCEASGFCSFPDPACDSGRRYGEFAGGGLSGACVAEDPPDTETDQPGEVTTDVSTSTAPGVEVSTSTGMTGPSADTSSSSSEDTGSTTVCPDDWWDCAWTRRQRVDIESIPLEEPVSQLPIPVSLDAEILDDPSLTVVSSDGELLPWERDDEVLWVAADVAPELALQVWAYAGNPAPPLTPRSPKVWDPSFAAVWHLSSGEDSTGSNDAAPSNTVTFDDGYFARAGVLDGMEARFDVPASMPLADLRDEGFTVEVRIDPDDAASTGFRRIVDKSDDAVATLGWSILLVGEPPTFRLQMDYGLDMQERQITSMPFELRGWAHLVVLSRPEDQPEFWLNGQQLSTSVQSAGLGVPSPDVMQPLTIGAPSASESSSRFFHGAVDELRISRGIRSPSWITSTYTVGLPDTVHVEAVEDLDE